VNEEVFGYLESRIDLATTVIKEDLKAEKSTIVRWEIEVLICGGL
jgi:hypothetical protein